MLRLEAADAAERAREAEAAAVADAERRVAETLRSRREMNG